MRTLTALAALALAPVGLLAQDIVTAEQFFADVSTAYGEIDDYQADITVTQGERVSTGELSYKRPNLLRIDFTQPEDQVLVTDGELLTIYYPTLEVIFEQRLSGRSDPALASEEGLSYLAENYAIAYATGPELVTLDELEEGQQPDPDAEMVMKLHLSSRSADETFREIEMAIGQDHLIRRVTGMTVTSENHVFDFENIRTNLNIPDTRFVYESPAFANVYRDFLFEPEQ